MRNSNASETIEKRTAAFMAALKDARARLSAGDLFTVHISNGNSKTGAVASVSTLPFITCPGVCKGQCAGKCYAAKIAALRPSVLKAYAENTALLFDNPAAYWDGIAAAVRGVRFFRWHVSGDIVNAEYVRNMARIAESAPHCRFMAFTKRADAVNAFITSGGVIPENLIIIFSTWGAWKPENPNALPESAVIFRGSEPADGWKICGGNCFECACRGVGCWELKAGETIAFYEH